MIEITHISFKDDNELREFRKLLKDKEELSIVRKELTKQFNRPLWFVYNDYSVIDWKAAEQAQESYERWKSKKR